MVEKANRIIAFGVFVALVVSSDLALLAPRLGIAAEGPAVEVPPASGKVQHDPWPFEPLTRPAVPDVEHANWVVNPVDAFILHRLEKADLEPSPPADRLTILRRLTFDLTGLPPTSAEQQAFIADDSPDAYERVVERLLDSPRYGERWGQYWLDLVRYAETDGFKADGHRPHAYKYRDYVIRAFNSDLPYDRFVTQQLAGDEVEPGNPDAIIATGLNRLYPDEYNAANLDQRRQEILDDVTETTGLVFMGLTMGCAQCHDHKFDAILQSDYFRLQAFFAPMMPCDDVPISAPEVQAEYRRRLTVWEETTRTIREEIDALLEPYRQEARERALTKFAPELQEAARLPEEERTPYQRQIAEMALRQVAREEETAPGKLKGGEKDRYQELLRRLAEFDHLKPAPLDVAMAVTDVGPEAPPTHLLQGGNFRRPGPLVSPGFPEFLIGIVTPGVAPPSGLSDSTGRRSALARWLTRDDHPLTARVMVNRLWQHHFGEGIVATPSDFGVVGDPPSHPELLDWLAVEFIENGWSLKEIQRLIVTSAAYRQSSLVDPRDARYVKAFAADPANRWLWRARRVRLEGEAVRDAMLMLSGDLNLRMCGPSERPALPAGISPSYAWDPDGRPEHRRSIYVLAKRNLRYPLFEVFDQPDMHHSCDRRMVTTTAPQALQLMNGELALEVADRWAERLVDRFVDDDDALIIQAVVEAFGRPPGNEELELCRGFLHDQTLVSAEPSERRATVSDFCHALLNANEFLYVD